MSTVTCFWCERPARGFAFIVGWSGNGEHVETCPRCAAECGGFVAASLLLEHERDVLEQMDSEGGEAA
jgi:hypothetical protein